jgi:hypothetical protein
MVQSKFNLIFWFVSYNIFLLLENSGARALSPLSSSLSPACSEGPLPPLKIADDGLSACIPDSLEYTGAEEFPVSHTPGNFTVNECRQSKTVRTHHPLFSSSIHRSH